MSMEIQFLIKFKYYKKQCVQFAGLFGKVPHLKNSINCIVVSPFYLKITVC